MAANVFRISNLLAAETCFSNLEFMLEVFSIGFEKTHHCESAGFAGFKIFQFESLVISFLLFGVDCVFM